MRLQEKIDKLKFDLRKASRENSSLHTRLESFRLRCIQSDKRIERLSDNYTQAEAERVKLLNIIENLAGSRSRTKRGK